MSPTSLVRAATANLGEFLENVRLVSRVESAPVVAIEIGAAALILVGLWTPIAGTVVTALELWNVFAGGDPWVHILAATLSGALALLGPGAWSSTVISSGANVSTFASEIEPQRLLIADSVAR